MSKALEEKVMYKNEHAHISEYFDFDYVADKGDKKSTIGYYTFVGRNLVTWRSKK